MHKITIFNYYKVIYAVSSINKVQKNFLGKCMKYDSERVIEKFDYVKV